MSQIPSVKISETSSPSAVAASASQAEKNATKSRSCVVCRTRKVRCDKLSPCSNCRRAGIACVLPPKDRPPRWARRLERVANNAADMQTAKDPEPAAKQVMERLRNLESLVKELSSQLEQANAANSAAGSSGVGSPAGSGHGREMDQQREASPPVNENNVQKHFGRMVLQDSNRSRYVSSGFWSRVNDELDGLKKESQELGDSDSDTSEDEPSPGKSSSTHEFERTPSERHAFLFQHNLNPYAPDVRELHPLPSQIPFLLDMFSENINSLTHMVYMPSIKKMIRDARGNMSNLTPANEALMFSIYYAAVASTEDEDIVMNFGVAKAELSLKYRLGFEYSLAKADFLNVPDLVVVQSFTIFLTLVRLHDSPRYVWMMTGLVIRMGQALGLQRDGANFKHLSPYEVEMRRRVWWGLQMLDMRASEDQGTELTIAPGSFDTKMPLNINEDDLNPETTQMPISREGITDMTFFIITCEMGEVMKRMVIQSSKDGAPNMEEQGRLLNEIYEKLEKGYLQYSTDSDSIMIWVQIVIARLVMAKMTLLVYLPVLFSSSNENFSEHVKTNLLIAAIENAEYNHALNANPACRQWRWVYQTYTHWHAIIYLLLEISRRPWSPIIERAWVALHSEWLIPAQSQTDKNLRFWVPLKKLTSKARKHRESEIMRLRRDPRAAEQLVLEDQKIPAPGSPGPFPAGSDAVELFHQRWRQLLFPTDQSQIVTQDHVQAPQDASSQWTNTSQSNMTTVPAYETNASDNIRFDPAYLSSNYPQTIQTTPNQSSSGPTASIIANNYSHLTQADSFSPDPTVPLNSLGYSSWLWADPNLSGDAFANVDANALDINMDMGSDVDWYNWVESAKGLE